LVTLTLRVYSAAREGGDATVGGDIGLGWVAPLVAVPLV
jgi:hypothetical protein